MRFHRVEIQNLLDETQRDLGRDFVISVLEEWLNDTTKIHASIDEMEYEDVDVDMGAIAGGEDIIWEK